MVITGGGALGMVVAVVASAVLLALLSARKLLVMAVARVLGAVLLATPALWLVSWLAARKLGHDAALLVQSGLAVTTLALAFTAAAQLLYVALTLALALLGNPKILWRALRVLPRHVLDLVRPFATCTECGVHYRGTCDGCGRTPGAPAPPKPVDTPPRKKGIAGLLDKARGERDLARTAG